MSRDRDFRRKNLEYLLKTKTQPERLRQRAKFSKRAARLGGLALLLGPIFFFHELDVARYIIGLCAAAGGILVYWGELEEKSIEGLQLIHDYIDFERIKAELDNEATRQ